MYAHACVSLMLIVVVLVFDVFICVYVCLCVHTNSVCNIFSAFICVGGLVIVVALTFVHGF